MQTLLSEVDSGAGVGVGLGLGVGVWAKTIFTNMNIKTREINGNNIRTLLDSLPINHFQPEADPPLAEAI